MSIELESELKRNVSKRTLVATTWIFFGHFWAQVFRFFGNLALTRLLLPADFGLMQLVAVFMQGAAMLSDLGLSVNIMQHKKGEDPGFLRTAWTIQIIRGIIITCILLLFAMPLAVIYDAPSLAWLIPLASVNAIVEGISSVNLALFNRRLQLSKLTLLELGSQFIGVIAMVICAWYWRSVWTLLVSGFVSGIIKTIFSHVLFPEPQMAVAWIKEHVKDIIDFGKWIFIGSMGGFLVSKLDRVVLGLYLTTTELGLYGIALAMPLAVYDLLFTLSQKILIPLYSHLSKSSLETLRFQTLKVRAALTSVALIPLYGLIILGPAIIDFLYPKIYHNAGWMLQIIAVYVSFKCITINIGPILYAVGNSFRAMLITFMTVGFLLVCMLIGGGFFGVKGVIWALPVSELLSYPALVLMIRRYGVWLPLFDVTGFVLTIILAWSVGML